jgi:hypothetical protein
MFLWADAFTSAILAASFAVQLGHATTDHKLPLNHRIASASLQTLAGHHPTDGGAPLCHFGLLIGCSSRFHSAAAIRAKRC